MAQSGTGRRTPKQQRAQVTVDALLTATGQLLVRDGYVAVSTNRIAKRAGVSVGTLYQYFSSKEDLVIAVSEDLAQRQLAAFSEHLDVLNAEAPPFEDGVRSLVDGVFAMKRIEPELSRVLMSQVVEEIGQHNLRQTWLRRCQEVVRASLYVQRPSIRGGDVELMAYVLVTSAFCVLEDATVHRRELVRTDALKNELIELILRYLRPDSEDD